MNAFFVLRYKANSSFDGHDFLFAGQFVSEIYNSYGGWIPDAVRTICDGALRFSNINEGKQFIKKHKHRTTFRNDNVQIIRVDLSIVE